MSCEITSLEIVYDLSKNEGEYLTQRQIEEQLLTHKYIVVSGFARDVAGDIEVAKVLYKGNNEGEAKQIWLQDIFYNGNTLYCEHGAFKGDFRVGFDVDDIEYPQYEGCEPIKGVLYPIGFFSGLDTALGEPVLTKHLKETGENIWYVVRVFDVDLAAHSFIGQVVFKGKKQEAVDIWNSYRKENGDGGVRKCCYIFNPFLDYAPPATEDATTLTWAEKLAFDRGIASGYFTEGVSYESHFIREYKEKESKKVTEYEERVLRDALQEIFVNRYTLFRCPRCDSPLEYRCGEGEAIYCTDPGCVIIFTRE